MECTFLSPFSRSCHAAVARLRPFFYAVKRLAEIAFSHRVGHQCLKQSLSVPCVYISGSLLLNGIAFAHLLAFQLERPLRRWRMWTIRERPITPFATYRYTSVKWVNYNYLLLQCYLDVQSRALDNSSWIIDQISFTRKISDKLFPFHKKTSSSLFSLHIKNVRLCFNKRRKNQLDLSRSDACFARN